MNAIAWMLNPPQPAMVGTSRVFLISDGEAEPAPAGFKPRKGFGKGMTPQSEVARCRSKVAEVLQAAGGRLLNANEIEEATGIPAKTIRRYMRALMAEGKPIYAKRGYGYVWRSQ